MAYNVPSIYDVAEGNVPKGKGVSPSVYAVLSAVDGESKQDMKLWKV